MLEKLKAQLKAAKAELRIRARNANATSKAYGRCCDLITKLENRIEIYMAKRK
jgi:hypothetical protein